MASDTNIIMLESYIKNIERQFIDDYKDPIFNLEIRQGVITGYVLLNKQLDFIRRVLLENGINPHLEVNVLSNLQKEPPLGYFKTDGIVLDIWKNKNINIDKLSPRGKSLIRSSQIDIGEVVRGLIYDDRFLLIQTLDGTIGWCNTVGLIEAKKPISLSPDSFDIDKIKIVADSLLGTPYLWGGATRQGFDCSGFTRKVYLDSINLMLPKNSYDQVMMCEKVNKKNIKNGDLVFGPSKEKNINHIGIFIDGYIYHSCLKDRKVVKWDINKFEQYYSIEIIGRIILDAKGEMEYDFI